MFMYVEMRKYMKKKLFSVLLVGALAASLVACGKTEKKEAVINLNDEEIMLLSKLVAVCRNNYI